RVYCVLSLPILICIYSILLSVCSYTFNSDLPSFPTRRSSDLRYDTGGLAGRRAMVVTSTAAYPGMCAPDGLVGALDVVLWPIQKDRKSTRLNSSHVSISYAVFCLKKKKK